MNPQLPLPLKRKGRPLARLPEPKEHETQIVIVDLLRAIGNRDWDWNHPASGEHRDKRTAAKLKAMGVRPGRPDLEFISPEGLYHGLELKRRGEKQNDAQKEFAAKCDRLGWIYAVADTLDDALAVLRNWGVLR